jgi:serine/threonine protein kinase
MSPEQIRGKLDDKSIDLYALAIIAYELLTARRPWDGDDPYEVMRAVLRVAAPKIERVHLSPLDAPLANERYVALNAFFDRALAKNLPERPATAAELVEGLEQALFGTVGAQPVIAAEDQRAPRGDDTIPLSSLPDTERMWTESTRRIEPTAVQVALPPREPSVEVSAELQALTMPQPRFEQELREELRAQAVEAAAALQASRTAERSWKKFVIPFLVIAALGGSLGYVLAGSASAQSNDIHDFVTRGK